VFKNWLFLVSHPLSSSHNFPKRQRVAPKRTKEKQKEKKKERRDEIAEVRLEISSSENKYSEIKRSGFWILESSNI
jgi:hypothetical protein